MHLRGSVYFADPRTFADWADALLLTPSTGAQPTLADQYDASLVILASDQQAPLVHPAIPVVASELTVQGIHMLLGRDVLGGCLLTYDGVNGLFSLAY